MSLETDRHWSLDKRVNISHIIGTLLLAGSIMTWAANMNDRLTRLEENKITQNQIDARQDRAIQEALEALRSNLSDVKVDLRAIRSRLDRMLDSNTQISKGN